MMYKIIFSQNCVLSRKTNYLSVRLKRASLVPRLLSLSHGGAWVQPLAAQMIYLPVESQ